MSESASTKTHDTLPPIADLDRLLFTFLRDQLHDIVFVLKVIPENRFQFILINQRFEETTGLTSSEVVGKMVEDVIPPESLPIVVARYKEAIQKRQTMQWDEVSEYPNGTKVGEVAVTPIYGTDGQCQILVGTVHDVTERHQTQVQLRELEERWRLALDASEAAAWDWDRKHHSLVFSGQWQSIVGYDWSRISPTEDTLFQYLHPDDHAPAMAILDNVLAGHQQTSRLDVRIRHVNGYWVWVRCHGKAVSDAEGNVVRILGTTTNITQAKAAEDALHLTSLVFEHSSEAISILDVSGHILMVNPAFNRMRGFELDEIIGQSAHGKRQVLTV